MRPQRAINESVEILIVEDSPTQAEQLKYVLEDGGYAVRTARNGQDALQMVRSPKPTLIISDVVMPEMDGYSFCKAIKAIPELKDIPVILVTTLSGPHDVIKGLECGADNFIRKPYDSGELLSRINFILTNQRIRAESKVQAGVQIAFGGQKYFITAERQQILDLLMSTYEGAVKLNKELHAKQKELAEFAERLEQKVEERTAALSQEIAERQRAEEELRLSEERFRKVFEDGPMGMALVDTSLRLLNVNEALGRMIEYRPADLLGVAIAEVTHAEDFAEEMKRLPDLASGKIPAYQLEKRLLTKSGKAVWVNLTASVVRGKEGENLFGLQIVQDISKRKQLETELFQAQKMEAIGRLAGGVAHDFNNLLTIINGYAQLMLDKFASDSPARGQAEEIKKAGERAASLTRQLLAFSRKQVLQPQVLDLNRILANVEKMLRRLIGEDIEIEALCSPQLGRIMADPGQIEQVFLNLAVNARDAMPKGGKLTLETANVELDEKSARGHLPAEPGSFVMLAVTDTGIGMDAETQKLIFEPFFTTKGEGKGTGLGLATVYGVVKQSGGHIRVNSELGRGTTFRIYLPRTGHDAQPSVPAAQTEKPATGSETILLVEDNEGVRGLARTMLATTGYRVLEAASPQDAARLCEQYQSPIHLLLTDVVMPGLSGRDLARGISATHPEAKILFMSGYTDGAIVHHGDLDAATNFLQKPFTPDALLRKVREVLDTGGIGEA